MKVNLLIGNVADFRNGYLNLDASIRESVDDRYPCSLNEWPGISPNEATEIVALGVLDHIPVSAVAEVFAYWVSRLAIGGSLHFSALDILETTYQLGSVTQNLVESANTLLYGGRQSAHTVESLASLAQNHGLTVRWKCLRGVEAVIEAVR